MSEGPVSGEHIDAATQEILGRSEFAQLDPNSGTEIQMLGELFSSVFTAVQAWLSVLKGDHPGVFALILALGLMAFFLGAVWLARFWARQRVDEAQAVQALPQLLRGDPQDLMRRARTAAQDQAWLEAVRLAFRASVIEQALGEGILEKPERALVFRRARTYRELVAEFARDEVRRDAMTFVAARLESALYGDLHLEEADWQRVLELRA